MIDSFVARRRPRWERLERLLRQAASPRRSFPLDEVEELAQLYRTVTSDLAIARRDFPRDPVTTYLNQLVVRAHGIIYRDAPAPLSALRRYWLVEVPGAYRAAWPYLLAAAALLFLPAFIAIAAAIIAPSTAELVMPPTLMNEIREGKTWFDIAPRDRPYAASFIMTHNIQIALLATAGGMVAGIPTVLVLVYNGVLLGFTFGALMAYGLGADLVGFVSPHGFLELSVIVVSGACGLMLAKAIVWAGLETRREALVTAASKSMRLLLGILPFLVVAGLIEGLVSPMAFAWVPKLGIGLATATVLYSYLLLAGRHAPRARSAALAPDSD